MIFLREKSQIVDILEKKPFMKKKIYRVGGSSEGRS